MTEVLEEFQRAEDFTDFADQSHAAFDLDPVQLAQREASRPELE